MKKVINIQKICKLILVILLLLSTTFSLCACMSDGGSGGSGGSGGGSGSGSGSGSGEGESGGSTVTLSSENEDDFFSGVMIMYDAGYSGEFYDHGTGKNQTFSYLLDRQIKTFTTHLLYGLNVLYGDNQTFIADANSTFNLLSVNGGLSSLWGGNLSMLGVKPATLLIENPTNSYSVLLNTNNFEDSKQQLANGITTAAELGGITIENNQLNFNNAILGGYTYEITDEENNSGEFTTNLNTGYAWSTNITGISESDTISTAIANILSEGEYSTSNLNASYEDALKNIEYLGFSKKDLKNISQYVLEQIIGNAYNKDESIRTTFPQTNINLNSATNIFINSLEQHYYRAYNFAINILVDRMADITTQGLYVTSDNIENAEESGKIMTYAIMPRTSIKICKVSEIFAKQSESSDITLDNIFISPILEDIKLKQIILIPKLSESIKEKYIEDLKEEYGSSYTNYIDYGFSITSINMSMKGSAGADESKFICLPKFTIVSEGEVIHNDKVVNEVASVGSLLPNLQFNAFYDDYAFMVDCYTFDPANDQASFTISSAMGDSKLYDYNGVEVYDKDNKVNNEFFNEQSGEFYLKLDKGASLIKGDYLYSVTYLEDGEFEFVFNGGENFLQMDFSYFDKDSTDIYESDAGRILPQAIDLMTLSVWT